MLLSYCMNKPEHKKLFVKYSVQSLSGIASKFVDVVKRQSHFRSAASRGVMTLEVQL